MGFPPQNKEVPILRVHDLFSSLQLDVGGSTCNPRPMSPESSPAVLQGRNYSPAFGLHGTLCMSKLLASELPKGHLDEAGKGSFAALDHMKPSLCPNFDKTAGGFSELRAVGNRAGGLDQAIPLVQLGLGPVHTGQGGNNLAQLGDFSSRTPPV